MKKAMILAAVLLFSEMAFAQGVTQGKKNSQISSFDQLDAAGIGAGYQTPTSTPPPAPKPELGPIDKWRYESCQQDAATAPTSQGVAVKMRICHEKFGQ